MMSETIFETQNFLPSARNEALHDTISHKAEHIVFGEVIVLSVFRARERTDWVRRILMFGIAACGVAFAIGAFWQRGVVRWFFLGIALFVAISILVIVREWSARHDSKS